MKVILCGSAAGVPAFAAASTEGEAARLLKEIQGSAVVIVTLSEAFAIRSAELHRDKRFFFVTEEASLEQWSRLEAAGVTPLAPADIGKALSRAGWRERDPVEIGVIEEVQGSALREELRKNPVRPVLLPVTAVTSLRGGAGKTTLIGAMAEAFRSAVPEIPVVLCTSDRIEVSGDIRVLPPGTPAGEVRGRGLVLAERPFSPRLSEEYDRILVVSRADGISLGRLAALRASGFFDRCALVFNATEKVALEDAVLPFPCVSVVPEKRSRGFDAGITRVLRYLCGDDYVFASGKQSLAAKLTGWRLLHGRAKA